MSVRKTAVTVAALAAALTTGAVTPATGAASADPFPADHSAASCAHRKLAGMSLEQQVGQLFVGGVDADRPTRAELARIGDLHLGGVVLTDGSTAGAAVTKSVAERVQAEADSRGVPLWVSADQEGGEVQHLKGPGFDVMPSALSQGGLTPSTLRSRAAGWGRQLDAAGVNLDLAPVLDTVPADLAKQNKPIGVRDREYGHTPQAVAAHGTAFQSGLADAGVQSAVKHFPGLGRVRGNTDTSSDVTDRTTTRHDAYLRPFKAAIRKGDPLVMISSARYAKIDAKNPALFSKAVMTGMLRGDLGFDGVIISDDLGSAAAVQGVPAARRALRFLSAGGTVVLSVDSSAVPRMVHAVVKRAEKDADFRARVKADAQRVLAAKSAAGLLRCT